MKAYPIWNDVINCAYKGSKSYGNLAAGKVNVLVGSSSRNSHDLISHMVTKSNDNEGNIIFKFGIEFPDGRKLVIAENVFENNNGRAGELIRTRELNKRVKGL